MKKLIALMLSALMLFALLTAAGAETVAPAHLNIWLAGNGEAETNEAFHKIFDAWVAERSPGSTYELSFIAWSDYFTKLSTALASGEGPDVFMTGYGQLGTIVSQGHTVNLSEKIPADWDGWTDIPQNLLSAGMKDGNVYGILEPATRLYYYNKEYAEMMGATEEELQIHSLDLNPEAVALTRQNACKAGVQDRVEVFSGDLFAPLEDGGLGPFDLVVSNPPYVPTAVLSSIPHEVSAYEPMLALDGGDDGLTLFRRLVTWSAKALRPGGGFACELHETCLDQAADEAARTGFVDVRIVNDLAGRPRVLTARTPHM